MAMQISNWLSSQLLNTVLRNKPFMQSENVFLALFTSDPTAADTGQEVSGGGYERRVVEFAEPSLVEGMQTTFASKEVEFPVATADWGLITHFGIYTAATQGKLLFKTENKKPRTVETGDRPKFAADGVSVKFIQ